MNASENQSAGSTLGLLCRAGFQLVVSFAIWGGMLFLAAGDFAWPRGWIHIGLWLVTFAVNVAILLKVNPGVISARMKPKRSTEGVDTILLVLFAPVMLAMPLVAGFDAVRLGWSSLPFWTVYLGIGLHVAGDVLLLRTMAINPFAEKTVRVQTERGHHVVTTGPYAVVRHPMYLGVVLTFMGIPLVLGSAWTFAPLLALTLLLMVRAVLEERLLGRDLPGYDDYMRQTRWRILPGIW